MQALIDALAARLPEGCVRYKARVDRLGLDRAAGRWRLFLQGGEIREADAVCLALPAPRAGALLMGEDAELAGALGGIPYASSVTVNLVFPREVLAHPLDGMGMVVPEGERRSILACTFSCRKFEGRAPDRFVLLRAFLGGHRFPDCVDRSDAEIERRVLDDLRDLLGTSGSPVRLRVHRHPDALPQYRVGHLGRVRRIEAAAARLPGLALAGNAYRGVGIVHCIRSARAAAERLLRELHIDPSR
jgi:oxygen-dependent protoporphyrinogen oxidase